MEVFLEFDTRIFLFLNGLHLDWLDPVMTFISGEWTWIPFYAILLFLVIRKYKWQSVWIVLGITALILCSDQLSAHFFKPVFQRPRPCHDELIKDLVYLPNGHCGGAYGFISSHACNVFALATFLTHVLKPYFPKLGWIMFIWAVLVAYSRIYMGVHYPGDVIAGALIGMLLGFLVGKLFDFIKTKKFYYFNKDNNI